MQSACSLSHHGGAIARRKRRAAWTAVAVVLLLSALVACQSGGTSAEAQNQGSSTAGGKLKVVSLPDPSFGGMPATFVAVPAGWQADGQMTANRCANLPFAAWNATSADGKSEFDVLPMFAWRWGAGAQYGQGCAPFRGSPKAADFLTLFASKLPGVQVAGAMPVADKFRSREENFTKSVNNNNAKLMPALRANSFGDVAAVRATDSNGNELRLRVWLQCKQRSNGGDCFAKVDILRAAKGKLDALAAEVDSLNLVQDIPSDQWLQAYMNRQQQIGARQMSMLRAQEQAGSDMLRNQFLQSSARLKQEHEAGLQQIETQGQHANASAMNAMNARSTAASDWRDYAADQQTVSGANGTYKTSSQYTNVWSSPYGPPLSDGRTFGSTDNTLDPNSATDNTFTQDHKVHGNGQPY
jgi:hypothetical protein